MKEKKEKKERKVEVKVRWISHLEASSVLYNEEIKQSMAHLGSDEEYDESVSADGVLYLGCYIRERLCGVLLVINTPGALGYVEFHTLVLKRYRLFILSIYDACYTELNKSMRPLVTRCFESQLSGLHRLLDIYNFKYIAKVDGLLVYSNCQWVQL